MAITISEIPFSKSLILCHPEFLIQGGNTQFVKVEGVPYSAVFFVDKSLWPSTTEVKILYDDLNHFYPITPSMIPPAEYGTNWDADLDFFVFSTSLSPDVFPSESEKTTIEPFFFGVFTGFLLFEGAPITYVMSASFS
jgi:hypothetical protein